ncbi:Farnesyltransferase subunit beta [Leucosporidium creatinivorum]|uniref:Protein farnesyltransferase subunit beta n=1 Tax=Leucosporidium creatinivorum TaxID=106004 RepID=A0A1Y2C7I2_9BASI|nr:Farnesyltransferase subunit beta [Leucosporidium creatinivorum]
MATSVLTMPWTPSPSDGVESETLTTQIEVEQTISSLLTTHMSSSNSTLLQKHQHLNFLTAILRKPLHPGYTALDASRPWLLYWTLHSMALFEGELDVGGKTRVVDTLRACQNPEGGFGGGPGQMSHLAPRGWDMIDRKGMYNFLMSVKQPDGSFIMHKGGEVDVRGCYCALTIATLLNILTPQLAANTSTFIASCQTYEGGLASSSHPFTSSSLTPPLGEAHGGYTFCAVASWAMLRPFSNEKSPAFKKELNLKSLMRWSSLVQAMPIEGGGFRGRTNKLVDGCYSWWCGGLFGVFGGLLAEETGEEVAFRDVFDRRALQEYVLLAAQNPGGGLRDKPGKGPDGYHTCYNLAGFSAAQHKYTLPASAVDKCREDFVSPFSGSRVIEVGEKEVEMILDEGESQESAEVRMREVWARSLGWTEVSKELVGGEENEVMATHPVFNLTESHVRAMMRHFYLQE